MVVWEKLVDVLPDAVLAFDATGAVCFANAAAAALLGYDGEALVGMPVAQLVPERLRIIDGAPFHERWARCRGDDAHLTAPVLFRRGVEIEVDWTFAPTVNGGGKPVVVALLRRRAEVLDRPAAAEDAATRILRLVFDHAPLGIFHFDDRGVITACNARFVEILGSTRQRLVGLGLRQLPDARIRRCLEEVLAGRSARFEGDYRSVTGDRVTPVRVEFAPILAGDVVLGGVGLAEDASERHDAERRAANAERLASLGTLAAGVVHELQNPLAFVVTNLDLALRLMADGEAQRAVENAREGAWRVANIVRDLKAFARSDEELRRPLDVHEAIEAAVKLAANQLRHRATLHQDLRATRRVRASEQRLVQLFVNLLLNAAEALPEGRSAAERVAIAARDDDDQVVVTVEDSGRGVAPELLDRLFEPFVTDKPGGMGLGLAICHGIVASLGGTITAGPASPRGTRFEVRLPGLVDADVAPESPSMPPPPRPAERGRVLVIDDEERLAETIRMALSPPHDVDVCTKSREVLAWIEQGRDYDVVLCDLMMPDLSGPELYERVQAIRPELASRFVFLTGGAFTPRTRAFLHDVPNPRLEKPFELEALERLVEESLGARTSGS